MSAYIPHQVVSTPYLKKVEGRARAWMWGWVVGLSVLAMNVYWTYQYRQQEKELQELTYLVSQNTKELAERTEQLAQAWEDQRAGIALVVGWAEYVKEREDLSVANRGPALPKVPSKGKATAWVPTQ